MATRRECLHVRDGGGKCDRDADFEVWFGNDVDDYTYSCKEHLGDMLTDEDEHRIWRVFRVYQ